MTTPSKEKTKKQAAQAALANALRKNLIRRKTAKTNARTSGS